MMQALQKYAHDSFTALQRLLSRLVEGCHPSSRGDIAGLLLELETLALGSESAQSIPLSPFHSLDILLLCNSIWLSLEQHAGQMYNALILPARWV